MDEIISKLSDRLLDINDELTALQAKADSDDRELDEREIAHQNALMAEADKIEADIVRREKLKKHQAFLERSAGAQTQPTPDKREKTHPDAPVITGGDPVGATKGSWGFRHIGEFANAVRQACVPGGRHDPRIFRNQPTTVGTEGVDADGGFAVPPDFREQIMIAVAGEGSLVSLTDQFTSSSNKIEIPKDETTPWQSTGGVLTAWEAEAAELNQSKPALLKQEVPLHKLTSLVPVSSELLEDAPLMDQYLRRKVPEKLGFAINLAIVQGTGTGEPEGIMNSGSKITQAAEPAQVADTIVFNNVLNMYSRMYSGYRSRAVWLANDSILPQLVQLEFPGDSSPVYLPGGRAGATLASAPEGFLMGRPVIYTESTEVLGDEGDLIFADLGSYLTVQKTGGVRAATSIHVWFNYDVMAFRFIIRFGGQSWLDAPITPRAAGADTKSNIVTLAARA